MLLIHIFYLYYLLYTSLFHHFIDTQFDEFPQGVDTALADMQAMYDTVQNRE